MSSSNVILKSNGIQVGSSSEKSSGWGDNGGIAQTNIASSHKTIAALFVASAYRNNKLEAKKRSEKFGITSAFHVYLSPASKIYRETYWLVQSI